MTESNNEVVRAFRGISVRLAKRYLENLGGEWQDKNEAIVGSGWQATFEEQTVQIGPTLELTEIKITFSGDESALTEIMEKFEQKAMRAGG